MINAALAGFTRLALALRYRVRTVGLERIAGDPSRPILFLPNHPALIDPIIVGAVLHRRFGVRFLADEDQIDRFFIRYLARRINVVPIPDTARPGADVRQGVRLAIDRCIEALRRGDNLVLYPAGHLKHTRLEDLSSNSAVETILQALPDVRVVLIRTRGLWGSRFSHAHGRVPDVSAVLRKAAVSLLASGVFFAPRRRVTMEFHEPADLPRSAGRAELNRYLEAFYNAGAPPARYVPYTPWERGGPRELPEPDWGGGAGDLSGVPQATRRVVTDYLREQTGVAEIGDEDHLARDLGMDSLAGAELAAWLAAEFGFAISDVTALETVGDVMLAACGESVSARVAPMKPIPARWFVPREGHEAPAVPAGATIAEVFLAQARSRPGQAIAADQRSGVKTYRDIIAAVLALRGSLAALDGERLGILLPAGVAADVVYLTALLAGKTPVMVNWTVGPRNLAHCLALASVRHVVTAEALVQRLQAQGADLSAVADRLVFLERLAGRISRAAKLRAWLAARLSWAALDQAAARLAESDPAVILFTSGSESLPKAVPLTHANLLANLRDIAALGFVHADDRLLGILPPFHSFGLTVTVLLPLTIGVPVAHHADPTDAAAIARLIEACRATLLVGTPTFLGGIVRAGSAEQLAPLRLAVTGAEKCPDRVYEALRQINPAMVVMEGYGVTECSPILSVNDMHAPRRGTIGRPLPSVQSAIVHPETGEPTAPGQAGMLLVRGPSVFGGYFHDAGQAPPSPFVQHDGKRWYRTGDLVSADAEGVLTFRGRLKRFVKLGGEMISLPAVEAALAQHHPPAADEQGPQIAIEAASHEDHPELVLFTTLDLDREAANREIRQAGLSPLHNIRRVIRLGEIPVLGTGKTDYRALQQRLAEEPGQADETNHSL